MPRYRHEYKYFLDSATESILRTRADGFLMRDAHVQTDGTYYIRSLYFDDYHDSCAKENEAGTDPRSKFRIRYYNNDTSHIRLEKKSKTRGMTLKESCKLSPEECNIFLRGSIPQITEDMPAGKKKLLLEMQFRNLMPKVIVSYERIPYVYPGGNVRVTFDRNISSSADIANFLEGTYISRPILPVGQSILEVKWDEVIPLHIKNALALDHLQWTAFSKYYMCRVYHL
ncbi:MAG: polyphosphate polymerase domain-containing protein [Oscillospiraceae bacterium]|nr:polyphosphate polymerase domain-containing protein [Oscillospiraceae bacterium]